MDFSVARHNMVESQIRPNGVTNLALIDALSKVQREEFVGSASRSIAYLGEDLQIGNGRFLLEPMVLARLLQLADIKPSDLVLDIGPGSGYSTAVLAQMAESVVGVEQDTECCETSGDILIGMGITNAAIICGNHRDGAPNEAPFDVIVLNGRVAEVPQNLVSQLAEGGRLVGVIGKQGVARITRLTKSGDEISTTTAFDGAAPLLCGFEATPAGFQF